MGTLKKNELILKSSTEFPCTYIKGRFEKRIFVNIPKDKTGNEELGEINILNNDISIADEISKLNKLKKEGTLSEEEYKKAKEKLLS